jgi:hypothetical protein
MMAFDEGGGLPWHLNPAEPYSVDTVSPNASAVVAILDSGLASVAPWRPVGGYCFITSLEYSQSGRNPDYTDPGDQGPTCPTPSWHGTKVASIIKAVAPNCRLSILRVLGRCGTGFASDVTDAIVWAAGGKINGVGANPFPAKIISMSLAGKGACPTYMQSAVNQALALGATLIAAAGNAGANASLYFPGNCLGVVSIGASTRQGTLASYSNWGSAFSAPGGDAANPIRVLTVESGGSTMTTGYAMGTSFAAPHVAGLAALFPPQWRARFVPFTQCYASYLVNCGEILKGGEQEETLHASNACTGSLSDEVWTLQAAYPRSGDSEPWHYCNNPCYVTGIILCDRGGGLRSLQIVCSDGNQSPRYGYQGMCDGVNPTIISDYGFTGIKVFAGGEINGGVIQPITGVNSPYGCSGCQTTYDAQCGTAADGRRRIVIGIHVGFDTQFMHNFKLLCAARRCATGFYYTGTTCAQCTPCPAGQHNVGCSETAAGGCVDCATCLSTYYRSGCGGLNAGTCVRCSQCAGGSSFKGCDGGGISDSRSCDGCEIGKYSPGGYERDCQNCPENTFTTTPSTIACRPCTTCRDGITYQSATCIFYGISSKDTVCTACPACTTGQYRTGCTGTTAGGCSRCGECNAGYYRSGCRESGESLGECTACPEGSFCEGGTKSFFDWEVTSCLEGNYLSIVPSAKADGVCSPCLANNYCAGGMAAPITCPAGWYCQTGKKTQCPSGSYCTEGVKQPTGCNAGTYSATVGASSASACQNCPAGKVAESLGASACVLCLEGTFSIAGAVACSNCVLTYQDQQGQSGCKTCSTAQCLPGEVTQDCTTKSDKLCVSCPLIANCRYSNNICADAQRNPTCACAAGYQMDSQQKCTQCPFGFFKAEESTGVCTPWTNRLSECSSFSLGTRVSDSRCIPLPPAPDNALVVGDAWKCNAGFEKQT